MGQLILFLLLTATVLVSLTRPWIGVVAAYLFVILTPQSIWWWVFQDTRAVLWIVVFTLLGFAVAAVRGKVDFNTIRNKRIAFLLVLWAAYILSYHFGAYIDVDGPFRFRSPDWAMSIVNKIFVLFLVACLCIDNLHKLKALVAAMVVSAIYLVYWANEAYLAGRVVGRMPGPTNINGGGIYADGNNFAMLFVVTFPFLWYCGFIFKNRYYRWALWLVIPFGWHAIFLTGSRGGLVGIAATMMLMVWRSKNKVMALSIVPVFIAAYVFQAGDVMKDRASTISEYESERSAASRLESWEAASRMIVNYPITGVGLASFGPAYPDHSDTPPHEAHNTFFQIAAESGVVAGLMYALVVLTSLRVAWRVGKIRRRSGSMEDDPLYWINEAVLVGFSGLVVCSLFLSLQLFEIFFCLCVMINAIAYIQKKEEDLGAATIAGQAQGKLSNSRSDMEDGDRVATTHLR